MTDENLDDKILEEKKKYMAYLKAENDKLEAQKKADEGAKLKAEMEKQKQEEHQELIDSLAKKFNLKPVEEKNVNLPDGVDVDTMDKVTAHLVKLGILKETGLNLSQNSTQTPDLSLEVKEALDIAQIAINVDPKVPTDLRKMKAYGSKYFSDHGYLVYGKLKAANDDASCDDNYTAWTPADIYANVIWYTMTCKGYLAGKVTIKGLNINAGEGGILQVRAVGARTPAGPLAACECLTCVSNTWCTYPTTVDWYGDYAIICDKDVFEVGEQIVSATLKTMSDGLAVAVDAEIYNQLTTATPGYTETSTVSFICDPALGGSCCSYGANLYREVLDLQARMRAAGYSPDYLIVHPRIANYLKYKEAIHPPAWMDGEVTVKDGYLINIAGLKVIEYCGASTCSDNEAGTSPRVAIMIDSSRAVSEVWGRKPKYESHRIPECLSTRYVASIAVAIDEMDVGAIGFINNP